MIDDIVHLPTASKLIFLSLSINGSYVRTHVLGCDVPWAIYRELGEAELDLVLLIEKGERGERRERGACLI